MVRDLYYNPPGTRHYNVCYKSGVILNRVTARSFEGIRPENIDWVFIVEAQRRATPEEIQQLCKGTWKGTP
jgi:hypothetical protein